MAPIPPRTPDPAPEPALEPEPAALVAALRRRARDLSDVQLPRLRACAGPLAAQQRLAAELREDLAAFDALVETLGVHADDAARRADRAALAHLGDEFRAAGERCVSPRLLSPRRSRLTTAPADRMRKDMRAALLHSKKTIDARARTNRDQLFGAAAASASAAAGAKRGQEKATDDVVMQASNDVTGALRRTVGLMQAELERSVLSHQMLEQSTATLRATSAQHDMLASATRASRTLVTALARADWLDRALVAAALGVFVLVVLFVLKQRVLDRGVRLAFWWTRFLPVPRAGGAVLREEARAAAAAAAGKAGKAGEMASVLTTHTPPAVSLPVPTHPELLSNSLAAASSVPSSISEGLASTAGATTVATLSPSSTSALDGLLAESADVLRHAEL
ncbi:Sec20-domain-containing protein, partial [Phellopilus nigrolimitatus]